MTLSKLKGTSETASWNYPTGKTDQASYTRKLQDGTVMNMTQDEYSKWVEDNEVKINQFFGLTPNGEEK